MSGSKGLKRYNGVEQDDEGAYVYYDEHIAALRRAKAEGVGETIESVTQWANETFGPATLGRQIQRAKEELAELEAIAETANYLKIAEEAADVCICLFRVMGSIDPEALNRKMTVNRTRQWRVDGDGCAYHVKAARAAQIEEGEEHGTYQAEA